MNQVTKPKRGRPPGLRSAQKELKEYLLDHPDIPELVDMLVQGAKDPEHKSQGPFMKIIMDRVAPISSFEKQSSIEPIQINICSIGPDGKEDEPFDTQVISYNTDTITEQ